MRFFQKIGKITILSIKLTANLTIWVNNSKNIGFFSEIDEFSKYLFLQIIECGQILAQKLSNCSTTQKTRW